MIKFILIFLFVYTKCYYIYLYRKEEKCFYDLFFEGNGIIVTYNIIDKENLNLKRNSSKKIKAYVKSIGNDEVVYEYESEKLSSKFSFVAPKNAEYKICFESRDEDLFNQAVRMKLEFSIKVDDVDLKDVATMKDFNSVNMKVKILDRKVENIDEVVQYMTKTEDKFSGITISTSKKVFRIAIVQIFIIGIISVYHAFTLRKFLVRIL